ncbi:MAG: tRNA lysidine(34) synthetase TilS [Chloroflexi bacterium]|nr:tRNA lysidine(34) synthetase TilS [Chloroflexota bacterium]
MHDLLAAVREAIRQHGLIRPGTVTLVAVSGGVDSLALLHALWRLRGEFDTRLHVATLDHELRGASSAGDAAFVRESARALDLPVTVGQADVMALAGQLGLGIEETARRARYTFLQVAALHAGAAQVAVGHQRDDQAETVLMHLIRGSGLDGLRGMLPRGVFPAWCDACAAAIETDPPLALRPPDGETPALIRPLLGVSRATIEAFASAAGLVPRQDATNTDRTYLRNRLRLDVLPALEALNPGVREAVARLADVLREEAALLEGVYQAALARLVCARSDEAIALDRDAWRALSVAERRGVIRAAIRKLAPDLGDLGYVHIVEGVRLAEQGATGSEIALPGGLVLRAGAGTLTIARARADDPGVDAPALPAGEAGPSFTAGETVAWQAGGWLFEARLLAPGANLTPYHDDPLAAALAVQPGARLGLRARRPGDRFRPRGLGGHSQKLSDTLVNMRVPARWRDRVPLLIAGEEIAWFVAPTGRGVRGRVSDSCALESLENRVILGVRWRKINRHQ